MKLTGAVSGYRLACQAANKSGRTLEWYEQKLRIFVEWATEEGIHTVEQVQPRHVQAFSMALRTWTPPLADYTVRGYVQTVKGFLSWAAGEDLIEDKVPRKISMPKVEEHLLQTLSVPQINLLYDAASTHRYPWARHRDRTIIAVLLDTGVRASELCGLTTTLCNESGREPCITIMGKGRRQRQLPIDSKTASLLHMYLNRWRPDVGHDFVFCGRDGVPLTRGGLHQIITRLEREAGEERFDGVRVSPHTFRHTFAFMYMKNGGEILRLSRLLGHRNVLTTENYLKQFGSLDARTGISVFSLMKR